uniref:Phosphatidylcholine transfer protein n=1 Tax=Phallusia mammillata TaxID=59560 RepID=A0A6F9DU22_9ASCI|nr:stAR-related lipid transfer protein 7, mitochondrial-like [Phallusia mammillata]
MIWKQFVTTWGRVKTRQVLSRWNNRWKNAHQKITRQTYMFNDGTFANFQRLYWSYLIRHYQKFHRGFEKSRLLALLFRRFTSYRPPTYILAGGLCSFSWQENSIKDEEIWEHINELKMLEGIEQLNASVSSEVVTAHNVPEHWETVVNEPNLKVWKLPFKNTGCMQYKVFGRFHDVTARQFFDVQCDLEYRQKWDKLALDVSIVDENKETGEQILRWISYFPYPLNSREYVFIRRSEIYKEANVLALLSRSVDHPKCAQNKKYVRVPLYVSDIVIKPHTHLDEPGLDYLLTYCDDPQTSIPSSLSAWVVSAGLPDYVKSIHKAALNIHKQTAVGPSCSATSSEICDFPGFSSREVEAVS